MIDSAEFNEGFASAQNEIRCDGLSPAAARRYLDMTTPRERDSFDAGHRAAMLAHADTK